MTPGIKQLIKTQKYVLKMSGTRTTLNLEDKNFPVLLWDDLLVDCPICHSVEPMWNVPHDVWNWLPILLRPSRLCQGCFHYYAGPVTTQDVDVAVKAIFADFTDQFELMNYWWHVTGKPKKFKLR